MPPGVAEWDCRLSSQPVLLLLAVLRLPVSSGFALAATRTSGAHGWCSSRGLGLAAAGVERMGARLLLVCAVAAARWQLVDGGRMRTMIAVNAGEGLQPSTSC